ncbi:MAG: FkbM family methyltransferase [Candidatus Krumholzibacteriota bacterium]|nr:FkbM family methyltransferase [Candidatus Krumholzibacteriota bacterium]
MLLGRIKRLELALHDTAKVVKNLHQIMVRREMTAILSEARYQDPRRLARFGNRVYSQSDEDGIIREIFNRIGFTSKVFIEFGIGDGLENNTFALLFEGWRGLWIEAAAAQVDKIIRNLPRTLENGRLQVVKSFITKDNIDALISSRITDPQVDLLSVDIDGNDYHVLDSIKSVNPRVVVIEYNAKFPPPALFCMEYDESHQWKSDDCFGASLKFLEIHLAAKGYCLVGCNLTGVNAFFVRQDLVEDKFLEPFSAENHFEPARYYLIGLSTGHRASYRALERSFPAR